MRPSLPAILLAFATVTATSVYTANAATNNAIQSPDRSVLCDTTFCADRQGISNGLTAQYLGQDAADKLTAQGDFNRTRFTLSNGIFCDTQEQRCYRDRYIDPKTGKRSPVALLYTSKLFGGPVLPHRPHR